MERSIVLKSRHMQRMEHRLGRSLEDFFEQRYIVQERTLREIADELNIDETTAGRWLGLLGIEARPPGPRRAVA